MDRRRIAIIGTGNVATHLIGWLQEAHFTISSVYTRHPKDHKITPFPIRTSLDYQGEECEFIVIATKDDAIPEIVTQLANTGQAIILHTSGTVPLAALKKPAFAGIGILYPLQTLQKGRHMSLENVPFLIEGDKHEVLDQIRALCHEMGANFQHATSQERLSYHISAVISANFTNHLLYFAEKFLDSKELSSDILRPLMEETIEKAFEMGAYNSQTGPARRGDEQTIRRHISLLDDDRQKKLYEMISTSILSTYEK